MTSATADDRPKERATGEYPFPAIVDWLLAAAIAIGGLVSLIGGSALVFVVDRDLVAEGIEGGSVTVTLMTAELTDAEMLDVSLTVVSWTGTGLVLTGLGLVLFAIGFAIKRHRTRSRARDGESVNSYWANAVLGAVVTGVVSFVPFSPGIGGALAGYLERRESDRTVSVGAFAGLLAMTPLLAILVFVFGGLVAGVLAIERAGMVVMLIVVLLLALTMVTTIGAGLGALGGYVGGRLAES